MAKNFKYLRSFGTLCFASGAKYANTRFLTWIQRGLLDAWDHLPTNKVRMPPCTIAFPPRNGFPPEVSVRKDLTNDLLAAAPNDTQLLLRI